MKYLGHNIRVGENFNFARVTLEGQTTFLRRKVTCKVSVHGVAGLSDRQILKKAAKNTKYYWNIPFYV